MPFTGLTTATFRSRLQQGFTLIELLVAMAISLVVIAAVSRIVLVGEQHKRQLTSTNDMEISAGYAMVQMDATLRSAGSGYMQGVQAGLLGCRIAAGNPDNPILPRSTAWPTPFDKVLTGNTKNLVLAPLVIAEKASPNNSDVLIVMRGNASSGDVTRYLESSSPDALVWPLFSNLGIHTNDLAIVSSQGLDACLLQHVAGVSGENIVNLSNTSRYYTANAPDNADGSDGPTLATMASTIDGHLTLLGSLGASSSTGQSYDASNVQFYMYGIDAGALLHRYDLLQLEGGGADEAADLVIADGVVAMYALYGIADNSGTFQGWVSPHSNSQYELANLSTTNRSLLKNIVALHVALIVRSPIMEQAAVAQDELTYFSGLTDSSNNSLESEFKLSESSLTQANHYRHRVIEATIPIRNALLQ